MDAASQNRLLRGALAVALAALTDKTDAASMARAMAAGEVRATLEHPAMQPERA